MQYKKINYLSMLDNILNKNFMDDKLTSFMSILTEESNSKVAKRE